MALKITQYGVEIPFDAPEHETLLRKLTDCINMSRQAMETRYKAWRDNESLFKAYVKETPEDSRRRRGRENGLPTYTTICIPYSYAAVMTAVTYEAQVFMGRSPILQFSGRNGQSEESVSSVEAIHEYQMTVGANVPQLYVQTADKFKYGFGVVHDYWCQESATISRIADVPRTWTPIRGVSIPIPGTSKRKMVQEDVWTYRGNRLSNVRPYDFRPDPRVSLLNLQQGEFCGREIVLQWHEIRAKAESGEFFNVEVMRKHADPNWNTEQGSPANFMPSGTGLNGSGTSQGTSSSGVDACEITMHLVPAHWGLPGSNSFEKWIFTVAQGRVIVAARPQQSNHGKFPYSVTQYDINGYEVASQGLLDIAKPLNYVMDWLLNSHFFAVRKSLNGNIIYDPSRVIESDLLNPQPGRAVRLKPGAYGQDPRTVWAEMTQSDPTASHLQAFGLFDQLFQRVLGISDTMQGQVSKGRKTATEVRTAGAAGMGRLKLGADWSSVCGFQPLALMMLSNTQQFYDWEEVFRVSGQLAGAREFINVTPDTIAGAFDYVPCDGTLPIDRTAQAAIWKELLATMFQVPALAAGYDIHKMFNYVAQLAGCKNIDNFRVEVTPDRLMLAQLKSGQATGLPGAAAGGSAMQEGSGYGGDSPTAVVQ